MQDLAPIATFREEEGISIILPEEQAQEAGLDYSFRAAWITLSVLSDLEAVGLTATVAQALADHDISCNVVAALKHDHIFVPHEKAQQVLGILDRLMRQH